MDPRDVCKLGSATWTVKLVVFAFLALTPLTSGAECKTIIVCEDDKTGCHYDNVKEVLLSQTSEEEPEIIPCD